MMKTSFRPTILLIALAMMMAAFIGVPDSALSQGYQKGADDVKTDTVDYDDGPHVYWPSDSTAMVFYLCQNEFLRTEYPCVDTLRFVGRCSDSAVDYVVPRHTLSAGSRFEGVSRVLCVSDIHGEYDHFANILTVAGVIDSDRSWIWGDGHLVIDGDVFDRGTKVTECLWLVHQLQVRAEQFGGAVHMLLGNHEMMILRGDNRYIHERYLDGIVRKSRIRHEDLFAADMALGAWLRSWPTAITIDDVLYVHAGISPQLLAKAWTSDQINAAELQQVDRTSSAVAFDETAKMVLGSLGPLWYRGYFYEVEDRYPRALASDIDKTLAQFGVSTIVVGHSGVDSVVSMYDGRVVAIDVDVEALGSLEALLVEDGQFYRIAGDGSRHPVLPYAGE